MTIAEERPIRPAGPFEVTIEVPPSKSLTHRALVAAALASGDSVLESPLVAEDTTRTVDALRSLGIRIRTGSAGDRVDTAAAVLQVHGSSGLIVAPASPLDLGGSGTSIRFLIAVAALAQGEVTLDGDARIRERPVGPLLEALAGLGVEARSIAGNGCPPVRVRGGGLHDGTARLQGAVSSQFVSALLLIAPLIDEGVTIEVAPPVASRPYIDLTLQVMERFGARPSIEDPGSAAQAPSALRFRFERGRGYHAARYRVPPDASSASYFFAAAAATGGRVTVPGIDGRDPQGDAAILRHLEAMGCRVESSREGTTVAGPGGFPGSAGSASPGRLRHFDLDLGATPDIVPTLAVLALFADGPSEIRNVSHLRFKESDRLHALATELERLGARVSRRSDGLRIDPPPSGPRAGAGGAEGRVRVETYRDHRIAMSFAVAGLVVPGVVIRDPACVRKSFPEFWDRFARLEAQDSA